MKYLVRINELKTKNDFLEERLAIIDEMIIHIENSKDKIIWEGSAKKAFINKCDEYIIKLKEIEKEIIKMIAYLESYHNNYDEEYEKLKNKYIRLFNETGDIK